MTENKPSLPSSLAAKIALRARAGKLCIAVAGRTPEELLGRARASLCDARFLELRLDGLERPADILEKIKDLLLSERNLAVIATCRRVQGGGNFAGSLDEELAVLLEAARVGCQIVDLEIESAEEAGRDRIALFKQELKALGTALLVSFHDFAGLPDLDEAAGRIAAFAPDYLKIVATAQTLAENLPVLGMIGQLSARTQVVGIAMGEEGLVSRVLGLRAGAAFTFASASDGAGTAPGQVTARAMREIYRADQLDQATRIFGVAGNPIAHSLSPLMQNAAFRREGVNAVLLPLRCQSAADLFALAKGLPLAGSAVTMPLKQQILEHLANVDPLTKRIGACNTLRRGEDGKLYGFNTDVAGVVRPLAKRLELKGARVAILGAGGASRAAVFGLVDQGAQVTVVNRTHESAVRLADESGAEALRYEEFKRQYFDVLLNSTPCGMAGSARALPIEPEDLNAGLVFDMVYNPLETPLLKLAREKGLPTISGVEMFVQQGVRQFEIWTGKPAPEAEMQRVVELALGKK